MTSALNCSEKCIEKDNSRTRPICMSCFTLHRSCTIDGRYYLTKLLGKGGFAAVYKANDKKQNNKPIAIKILWQKISGEKTRRDNKRFIREINELNKIKKNKINLKNIVEIYNSSKAIQSVLDNKTLLTQDFIKHKDLETPYYTMEYLHGKTLGDLMENNELIHSSIIPIFEQVCEVAHILEVNKLVHRDIKPMNMIITNNPKKNHLKVIDFGIVKNLTTDYKGENLTEEVPVGTMAYMAPEQFTAAKVDNRADIYSIGKILHEMISKESPMIAKPIKELALLRQSKK